MSPGRRTRRTDKQPASQTQRKPSRLDKTRPGGFQIAITLFGVTAFFGWLGFLFFCIIGMEQLRPSTDSIVKLHIDRAIHLTVRYPGCSLDIKLHTSIPVVKAHIKNVLFMLKEPHVETKKVSTHALGIDRYADMQYQTKIALAYSHS